MQARDQTWLDTEVTYVCKVRLQFYQETYVDAPMFLMIVENLTVERKHDYSVYYL